jgi:hypothetical protein
MPVDSSEEAKSARGIEQKHSLDTRASKELCPARAEDGKRIGQVIRSHGRLL